MLTIIAIVVIALAFDYINGFHDAANSIATVVSTRVLTPRQAVVWAAFFNFIAFVVFPLHVAHTIGKGIIDPKIIDDAVLFGALGGAIAWNLITWLYGLPSSSSHALVGRSDRRRRLQGRLRRSSSRGVAKTALFIVISPVLGMLLGGGMMVLVAWMLPAHAARARSIAGSGGCSSSRRRCSASATARNDAQKTMGIIMAMLIAKGHLGAKSPAAAVGDPVVPAGDGPRARCRAAGASCKTMGMRLTKLKPFGGFCAETGAAGMLFLASALGVPVSTTHTITGGIVGVGWVNTPVERALAGRLPDRLGLAVHDPVRGADQRRHLHRPARPGNVTG